MKKVLFCFVFAGLIISCTNSAKKLYENPVQLAFNNIIDESYKELNYNATTALEKDEKCILLYNEMQSFLDSVNIFISWKGVINNLKISDTQSNNNYKVITFDILTNTLLKRGISYNSLYVVDKDSILNDSIYSKLRTMKDGDIVFFDGVITRNKDFSVKDFNPKDLDNYYHKLQFSLLDINTIPKDKLSNPLEKCVNVLFKSIKQLPRYEKSEDVLSMEALGMNMIPNNNTVNKKREEFVDILNNNGYQNLYLILSNEEKKYCDSLLGYLTSFWEFGKF